MRRIALAGIALLPLLLPPLVHAAPAVPAPRWVDGNEVVVRAGPNASAARLATLSRNAAVTLLSDESGAAYCQVRSVDGTTGFAACRYLVPAPLPVARGEGQPGSLEADSERVFWQHPNWSNLELFAQTLRERHPSLQPQGPFPRNAALEKMKARLAQGMQGSKPAPFADWADLKRKAAHLRTQGKALGTVSQQDGDRDLDIALALEEGIGLHGQLHSTMDAAGQRRLSGLIDALEFAGVTPSLFRSEAQLAPPTASAEQASGRFGILFRQQAAARPKPEQVKDNDYSPGLYDILSRTDALLQPVQRVQLKRDGRLLIQPSTIRNTETLWREADAPMCGDWVPGFAFGAADAGAWGFFGAEAGANRKLNTNPPGSLFAFYTTLTLPSGPAGLTQARMTLERGRTGFVNGTHLYYDLDADGVADLAVWEGRGKGPGHLDQVTRTDDSWYRLVLVNINGVWKVLGSDSFAYGCGC
jgi:hypothetical protein